MTKLVPFLRGKKYRPGLTTGRIEALSDGIFGFALTLLVLALTVPQLSPMQLHQGALLSNLLALWPKLLTYLVSALIIIIYWIGHVMLFHFVNRSNRNFMWLNSLFLIMIAFFPFPVGLLGEYPMESISLALYGATLAVTGLFYAGMWFYATTDRHLINQKLSDELIKKGKLIVTVAPITYLVGIILAFVSPALCIALYILTPIAYILPGPVDEFVDAAFE
jgi:uncharacterized membrane protein